MPPPPQPTPEELQRRHDDEVRRATRRAQTAEDEIRRRGRDVREDAESLAAAAAVSIGCLATALIPFAVGGLIIILLLILWAIRGQS
jgi:hypothetical protein